MKCPFLVKISIYKNKSSFCNLTGKVLKIYSYYLSYFKFDAALFNLHISCIPIFSPKYFRFSPENLGYILGNLCFAISYISEHCHIRK